MKHLTLILVCAASASCLSIKNLLPRTFGFEPRIINGDIAHKGQFPWQAAIYVNRIGGDTWCGGSLISDKWILTAGHCVQGATNFQISLGANALVGNDPGRVVLDSSQYILHKEYDPRTLVNDIAVIQLPESVNFNGDIAPISLSSSVAHQGTTVTVSGWGLTSDSDDGPSPILNYASLVIISNNECDRIYGSLHAGVVCASGGFSGQSTCEGDSGGPLVTYASDTPVHVGIVSFGHPDGCESGNPVAFTRTDYFRSWINEQTGV